MLQRTLLAGLAVLATAAAPGLAGAAAGSELEQAVARLEAAETSYDRVQLQGALDAFSKLAVQKPTSQHLYYLARAHFPLVNLHDWDGDPGKAEEVGEKGIEHLKKALEIDEAGNPDAYRLLGDFYGRLSLFKGLFGRMRYGSRSMTYHKKAIERAPESFLAVIGSGTDKLYAPGAFGGDVDAAVELFHKAIALQPRAPQGYVWLAKAYLKQKRYDLARGEFRKAVEIAPESGFVQGEIKVASREHPELGSVRLASQ